MSDRFFESIIRYWRSIAPGVLVVFFLSPLILADTPPPSLPPAPGILVDVGDHRLHLNCSGQGSPTVILESGLGGNSLDWTRVVPGIASFTRVCAYDRAGYGWSEMGPMPRTGLRIAEELHQLLQNAQEQGPYLLVGHSFGGLTVRLFASRYHAETVGLVLVDASHELQFDYLRQVGAIGRKNHVKDKAGGLGVPENLPAEVSVLDQFLVGTEKAMLTMASEGRYFQFSGYQTRLFANSSDGIPVTVLSRGRRVWAHDERGDRLEAAWETLQQDLFRRLGTSRRIASDSGHYIQLDQPRLVIDSIRSLAHTIKRGTDGLGARF